MRRAVGRLLVVITAPVWIVLICLAMIVAFLAHLVTLTINWIMEE